MSWDLTSECNNDNNQLLVNIYTLFAFFHEKMLLVFSMWVVQKPTFFEVSRC
jgi:hypothetical protein